MTSSSGLTPLRATSVSRSLSAAVRNGASPVVPATIKGTGEPNSGVALQIGKESLFVNLALTVERSDQRRDDSVQAVD